MWSGRGDGATERICSVAVFPPGKELRVWKKLNDGDDIMLTVRIRDLQKKIEITKNYQQVKLMCDVPIAGSLPATLNVLELLLRVDGSASKQIFFALPNLWKQILLACCQSFRINILVLCCQTLRRRSPVDVETLPSASKVLNYCSSTN